MKDISITERLILFFVLIGLVGIASVGTYAYFNAKQALLVRTYDQLISLRLEKKNRVEQFFTDRRQDAGFIARSRTVAGLIDQLDRIPCVTDSAGHRQSDLTLDRFISSVNAFHRLYVINRQGASYEINLSVGEARSDTVKRETGVDEIAEFCSRLESTGNTMVRDLSKTRNYLLVGAPVTNSQGQISGFVILEIPASELNRIMFDPASDNGMGLSGETYLVGSDHLMRSNSRFQGDAILNIEVNSLSVSQAFRGETGVATIRDYRNISCLSSYSPVTVPGLDWVILAEIDVLEAMTPVYSIRNSILLISVIIAAAVFGIALLLSVRLTAPIKRLQRASEQIAAGDYNVNLTVASRDELGQLTHTFNTMAEQLKRQSGEIEEEKNKRISSLIDGQEMERQRLARDLHDSLGQSVLSAHIRLEQARKADPARSEAIITETQEILKHIIQDIRTISNDLMPGILANFGIEQALRNLCREAADNTGIEIGCSVSDLPERLNPALQIYLYRITQEAINNIIKHSGANHASVDLSGNGETLFLSINDNGSGFDTAHRSGTGSGIPNIYERVRAFHGTCEIRSTTDVGTTIEISIPLVS